MEKLGLNKIREMFQEFYEAKEHLRQASFSLIPQNDKSLLIINSGMAPLKPYFAGLKTPPAPRMVTCQKCIRTADIENVGVTSRHGTFFEMLGSFSFGDYFKEESIKWGWEFITTVLKLPEDKLWVSVYLDDDEAYNIWKNTINFPEARMVRLGKDDNFWEIGTGPCGPCSEIYYDRGKEYGCDKDDCKPGCDCDRYIEFWNHVFTQYYRDDQGNYSDLKHKNIDTGMGLERLACIMQGVDSIFDVDTIEAVLEAVVRRSGVPYKNGVLGKNEKGELVPCDTDISIRIVTDHIRSATFMIGDKIMPSNEGRGYVLRRLIRRAVRHGYKLGIKENFLADLVGRVIDTCGGAYQNLEEARTFIIKIIEIEENKFNETLNQGLSIIEEYIRQLRYEEKTVLDGEKAFKLHDTYGFPVSLTEEIVEEQGFKVDIAQFNISMQAQKNAGKKDAALGDHGWKETSIDFAFEGKSEFVGYEKTEESCTVKGIFWDQKALDVLREGDEGRVIFDRTPFYPEGGGQAADIGVIYSDDTEAEVLDTIKFQSVIAHRVKVITGEINPGEVFQCVVNTKKRHSISRNHTSTHILHKVLKEVLGEHVQQAGSSVTDQSLRFDFNHFESVSPEDLKAIEEIVNDKIDSFLEVSAEEMPIKEAAKLGAVGLFEEKYGSQVRVVTIEDFSMELCGGIHVTNTGQIGGFRILSESGIASGVRRIEAVTGRAVLQRLIEKEKVVLEGSDILKSTADMFLEKLRSHMETSKLLKKELDEFKKTAMNSASTKLIDDAREINGVRFITRKFEGHTVDDLRAVSDSLRSGNKNLAIVLATVNEGKVTFLSALTEDLVSKGFHAGKIIKEVATIAGGGGGGKADMAQAGGKDPSKVEEALNAIEAILSK